MGRKQTVNAILNLPEEPRMCVRMEREMWDFYIAQIEKQLNHFHLTKEQRLEVVDLLAQDYRLQI